jgi:hypothetical protein
MWGKEEMLITFCIGTPEWKDHLEGVCIDGRMLLTLV